MIRTVLTPDSQQITLPIPEKYVGNELEILIFPTKDTSSTPIVPRKKAVFGCAKGKFRMADDFDSPLEDFKEYMQP